MSALYSVGLILETEIGLMWPLRAAERFQLVRSIRGATLFDPSLPPVVAIKAPSEDQESLLKRLIDCCC